MKENVDKHLEHLADKVMKQSTLETPSFDFTSKVMSSIELANHSINTTYTPLISKPVWALIVAGFIGFVASIFVMNKPETSNWFDFDNNQFSNILSGIQPSQIATYGIVLLGFMMLVQITFLKNYFNKRLEL